MLKKSIEYFQDHIYHAILVPFEHIMEFTRFMGQIYLLSGEELIIIKDIIEDYSLQSSNFLLVMLKSKLPDFPSSSDN